MESLTKPKISNKQVTETFVKHYGERPASIVEATNGWFGAVFLVELSSAKKVLKVAPPPSVPVLRYEKDLLLAEVQSLALVSESCAVPVPAVEFFVAQSSDLGSPYMITNLIEGVTLGSKLKSLSRSERGGFDRQIGEVLSNLHTVRRDQFGTFLGQKFPTWQSGFLNLVADLRQDAIDASVQVDLNIFELFDKHAECLASLHEASLVHWDMWDENILINPETLEIAGIVDFERAQWGDPLMEWNFKTPSPDLLAACKHIRMDADALVRRKLYSLYLALILVTETTYRGFNEDHLAWCNRELEKAVAAFGH